MIEMGWPECVYKTSFVALGVVAILCITYVVRLAANACCDCDESDETESC